MPRVLSSDSEGYKDTKRKKKPMPQRHKRRRIDNGRAISVDVTTPVFSLEPLLQQKNHAGSTDVECFDDIMDNLLPDYLRSRLVLQEESSELDEQDQRLRPLTRSEVSSFIDSPTIDDLSSASLSEKILVRKLKLRRERRRANLEKINVRTFDVVTPLSPYPATLPANPQVIDALDSIRKTPFENSFLSRLHGTTVAAIPGLIAIDWETVTPWMGLMNDIREHHILSHPEGEHPVEALAPIAYTSLQPCHLNQVHDLLERSFWTGIDVSDSLDYSPERCTVVATYKRLVIGVAILSSPQEPYITYLAVKAGWDNAQIATSMLYHLITLNPKKDITLHVSVNNPAMLLYNRFGFKAEEFVAGFYEKYLDPQSRASKNAFRLRLRQQ